MRIVISVILIVLIIDLIIYSLSLHLFLLPFPIILLTGLIVYWIKFNRPKIIKQNDDWELGQGEDWSNPEQPQKVFIRFKNKFFDLGLLILGGMGSGKTVLVISILYYLIKKQPECGWAYFEGKGDIDIVKMAISCGAEPDFFFSSELPHSHTINLMEGDGFDVSERLTKVLISSESAFYSGEQRAVLLKILPLLCGLNEVVNLRDLYAMLCVEEASREVLMLAKERKLDESIIAMAETWLKRDFENRVYSIAGMLSKLLIFVHGPNTDRINAYDPDISLYDMVKKNKKVFFHLPEGKFAYDLAVMFTETLAIIAKQRQLAGPKQYNRFYQFFDDWGSFFYDGFKPYIARCRSARMPLAFGFQSTGQAKNVDPQFFDEIDDATATKVVMRINGQATLDYGSKVLGTYETKEISTSQLGDRDGTSIQHLKTSRVTDQDMKTLIAGEAFLSMLKETESGKMDNPMYRLRFPYPPVDNHEGVDLPMPLLKTDDPKIGLRLWDRYMTPQTLKKVKTQINNALNKTAESQAS